MSWKSSVYSKVRKICLSFPNTKETITWGKPHYRVGEKIFAGFDDEGGRETVGFKLEMEHAQLVIADPRFERAPYVGHKGWVTLNLTGVRDWDEVRALLLESYRLIAPKKALAELDRQPAGGRKAKPKIKVRTSRKG